MIKPSRLCKSIGRPSKVKKNPVISSAFVKVDMQKTNSEISFCNSKLCRNQEERNTFVLFLCAFIMEHTAK